MSSKEFFPSLKRTISEQLIALAFAFCAFGVFGLGFFAFYLLDRSQEGDAWVLHTVLAIGKLDRLHLTLVEAESAGRGFLISGSPRSRTAYESTLARIDDELREFREFTSDNSEQQKLSVQLEQTIARRFAYLGALVQERVNHGVEAVSRSAIGGGVREMQSIDSQIARMKGIEEQLLTQRQEARTARATHLQVALAFLIAFGIAIMGGVFWRLKTLWLARVRAEHDARHEAHHDALTGLPNRRLLDDRMTVALARARRYNEPLAVLCLDLDGFKPVNDTHGHDAGDDLLRQVGERLQKLMRTEDTVARTGGDEFVVVLSQLSDPKYSDLVARRIVESVSEPYRVHGHDVRISTSVGIALYGRDGVTAEALLKAGDEALYRTKQRRPGRGSAAPASAALSGA